MLFISAWLVSGECVFPTGSETASSISILPHDHTELPRLIQQRSAREAVERSDGTARFAQAGCDPGVARLKHAILPLRPIPVVAQRKRLSARVERVRVRDVATQLLESRLR